MKFTARIPVTAALLALLLITATGCNRLKARDQLTKGVQAFKNARYEEAVNHFQNSIALDPDYEDAKLYLATAYSYQVVPNLDTPENLAIAQKAMDGFNAVLAKNPNDLTALKQIASINRNIKKFDVAKEYEKKVIAIAPNDPEAYYTVGFVDWTLAYKNAITILAADGLTDQGDGNPKKSKGACQKLQAANTENHGPFRVLFTRGRPISTRRPALSPATRVLSRPTRVITRRAPVLSTRGRAIYAR